MSKKSEKNSIWLILFIFLFVSKVFGLANISWIVVFLPLLIPTVMLIVCVVLMILAEIVRQL